MTVWQRFDRPVAMASRWRRRQLCVLVTGGETQTVALREISGAGARIDTGNPPALGAQVELRHPHAGSILGKVREISESGIRIGFDGQEAAIAFALDAIMADMTRD